MALEIFAPVIGTVQEFINWSLTIVSLMIIWYAVKFFMVAPPTEEEKEKSKSEYEERGAKLREWFGKQVDKKKKKEEAAATAQKKKTKREKVSPAKQSLLDAVDAAEEISLHLSKGERKLAHKKIQELNQHMDKAWKNLQLLRRKHPEDKEKLTEVIETLHAAQEEFLKDVKKKLPKKLISASKADWDGAVSEALPLIKKLRGSLGNAWKELENLHK